ncbi:hemerythrin domain-containing protein [Sphingobium nicotianae]|uniref:Hemerythrin domain-containing protein n=1 Tax=Sphingobium nicotianae TaxID=2782607 RepID=A0A9X1IQS7_9SPHN|nr:hemerythrin domain-containing protein [Sphingobium nicotianae]MBT2186943.1 hemerythrin domain-containing protein [Sphingobium nicotianae]
MEVDFLKAEHAALMDLRARLLNLLDGPPDPAVVTQLRATMNRILLSHLAKEDAHLYPYLKRDPETAPVAERFERELGGLALSWGALMTDWTPERIATDWRGFGATARPVLDMLAERARREEEELYPLLAKKGWSDAA